METPQTTLLATWKDAGKVAIEAAWAARHAGSQLLECIESGLGVAEEDPSLIAIGLGSLPNAEGVLELDASMMDGTTLEAGAVCSVRDLSPVISLARMVMQDTPHVMLAGNEARNYGISRGLKPQTLERERTLAEWRKWKEQNGGFELKSKDYVHSVADIDGQHSGDTITMLGMETLAGKPNHLVAASSTSGLAYKMPGRVGDSPIVGAGIYADDEIGAAGATGMGEELWKADASFRTICFMEQGRTPQEACEATVEFMARRLPKSLNVPCVVFAINKQGQFGAALTVGTFDLWICQDGKFSVQTFQGKH